MWILSGSMSISNSTIKALIFVILTFISNLKDKDTKEGEKNETRRRGGGSLILLQMFTPAASDLGIIQE